MKEFRESVVEHLEMMAAAYVKATNIPIEECELVVQTLPDKIVYRFQRRESAQQRVHPTGLMCASCEKPVSSDAVYCSDCHSA